MVCESETKASARSTHVTPRAFCNGRPFVLYYPREERCVCVNRSTSSKDPEVTPELLAGLDRPGPRYTSYPTVPEWHAGFTSADYKTALETAAESPRTPLSLYIHIPFCRSRCAYCGCTTTVAGSDEDIDDYIESVHTEAAGLARHLAPRKIVNQLHFGGGTPTTLRPTQLRRVFDGLAGRFEIMPGAEIAIEVDPRVTTEEHVDVLVELGFNRVSMGVQDLDPAVQAAIGRNQTEEQTRRLFNLCRQKAFAHINMDLVYGLPCQTLDNWERTVRTIAGMRPDRLAVYSFAYLPARLTNQAGIDADAVPVGLKKYELFAAARRLLIDAGYRPIGMDHFAVPEDELAAALDQRRLHRNFMGYTVLAATDAIGIGMSAISDVAGYYAQNVKRLDAYYDRLQETDGRGEPSLPTARGYVLSSDDKIRRWVIRQIMCNFVLEFGELEARFGVDFDSYFAAENETLADLENQGLIERKEDSLIVSPLGRVFVRNIAMVFDSYLEQAGGRGKFSRTI